MPVLNSDGGLNCVRENLKYSHSEFYGKLKAVAVQGFQDENIRIEAA